MKLVVPLDALTHVTLRRLEVLPIDRVEFISDNSSKKLTSDTLATFVYLWSGGVQFRVSGFGYQGLQRHDVATLDVRELREDELREDALFGKRTALSLEGGDVLGIAVPWKNEAFAGHETTWDAGTDIQYAVGIWIRFRSTQLMITASIYEPSLVIKTAPEEIKTFMSGCERCEFVR